MPTMPTNLICKGFFFHFLFPELLYFLFLKPFVFVRLPSDLGIKHESVVAISNHSLFFSEKEVQLTEADWLVSTHTNFKELPERIKMPKRGE
jgi:uncharacterized membrane protein